jgi:hypothetical protein
MLFYLIPFAVCVRSRSAVRRCVHGESKELHIFYKKSLYHTGLQVYYRRVLVPGMLVFVESVFRCRDSFVDPWTPLQQ